MIVPDLSPTLAVMVVIVVVVSIVVVDVCVDVGEEHLFCSPDWSCVPLKPSKAVLEIVRPFGDEQSILKTLLSEHLVGLHGL